MPRARGQGRISAARRRCGAIVQLLLAVTAAPAAYAGADCTLSSANVNFGAYEPALATPDDTAVTVTVTCSYVPPRAMGVSYTITLSSGLNAASPAARRMAAGTNLLPYNVYDDPARTRIWGTGSGGTVVASGSMTVGPGVGNGTRTATHVLYGRIPPLLDVGPGNYLDTLVLTLTY